VDEIRVEDGGLAAAGGAHDGDELLVEHVEGDAGDGRHLARTALERLGDLARLSNPARAKHIDSKGL
jgi:hypothetical protein